MAKFGPSMVVYQIASNDSKKTKNDTVSLATSDYKQILTPNRHFSELEFIAKWQFAQVIKKKIPPPLLGFECPTSGL